MKFYYGGILKKNFAFEIKRPRKDQKLPVVLSKEEISRLLFEVTNINITTRTAERVFEQACEKAGIAERFKQNKKSI